MSEDAMTTKPPPQTVSGYERRWNETSQLFPEETLQHLSREEVTRCQALVGHGEIFGVWETPEAMIGNRRLTGSQGRIDLRERIGAMLPEGIQPSAALDILLDDGVLQIARYALLLRLGPAGMRKAANGNSLDATTALNRLQGGIPRIFAKCIARRLDQHEPMVGGLLAHLTAEDLTELQKNRACRIELDRMRRLAEMGLWYDAPPKHDITRTTNPKGERATPAPEEKSAEYQPIPDAYLEQMGPRVLWIVEELGPNLLHLLEVIPELFKGIVSSEAKKRRLARYFEENIWRDRKGNPLGAPPFTLRIGDGSGFAVASNPHEWPPRTSAHVQNLSATLQSAHLWIVLLALAGRDSEVQTLKRDCIFWDRDSKQYAGGKTYKLSSLLSGEERDWPAPEALVLALGQQRRLVEAWERIAVVWSSKSKERDTPVIESDHLWASLGRTGNGVTDRLAVSSFALMQLARRIGLSDKPGGINLHPHRFRKTVARLMAIAAVDSPHILNPSLAASLKSLYYSSR